MTAVILDTDASLSLVSALQDQISNSLSRLLGKWSFEYNLFRANPASFSTQDNSSFLYTLTLSQYPEELFCLCDGMTTMLKGDFEIMMASQLQSLWLQRQAIKGDGSTYELNGGQCVLRLANLFLQGSFKGLLVELEYKQHNNEDKDKLLAKVNSILEQYNFKPAQDLAYTKSEIAWKYVSILTR
jgi:hypothetical protein